MITINIKAIVTLAIFTVCVWWGRDVWLTLAAWLVEWPSVRFFIAGFIAGCFVPTAIGWNAALRYRRDLLIEQARQNYVKDKRAIIPRGKE